MLTFKAEVWFGVVSVVVVLGLLGLVVTKQVWFNKINPFQPAQLTQPTTGQTGTLVTPTELAKHNQPTDCWVSVQGKVYNLTSFATTHSGGAEMIFQSCGKDGTDVFATRYGEGPHPARALSVIAPLQVGLLGQ